MALVVQEGETVVEGADSYRSLDDADAYFVDHGSPAAWTAATDGEKEAALRYATRWIDERYDWRGAISSEALDRLKWPRLYAVDPDGREWTGTPEILGDAACEVAVAHLGTGVNEVLDRGGAVKRRRVEGAVEIEYMDSARGGRIWPFVDRMLRNLYVGSPSRLRVARS